MNIYNLNNAVVIQVEELEGEVVTLDYSVSKYDTTGCLSDTPITTGVIPEDHVVNLTLPDGYYKIIAIDPLGDFPDFEQDFFVFYNIVPRLASEIQKISCGQLCNSCKEESIEDLFKLFYEVTIYINCIGLLKILPMYRHLSYEYTSTLNTAKQRESLYGKFNFNYKESLYELFLVFLLELYENNISLSRKNNTDLEIIKSMFRLKEIRNCLDNSAVGFRYLDSILNQIDCLNDE